MVSDRIFFFHGVRHKGLFFIFVKQVISFSRITLSSTEQDESALTGSAL